LISAVPPPQKARSSTNLPGGLKEMLLLIQGKKAAEKKSAKPERSIKGRKTG
jgi:hypothetical protein